MGDYSADVEMYNRTLTRLQNLDMRRKNLLDLAADAVLDNLERLSRQLGNLPLPVSFKLIHEMEKRPCFYYSNNERYQARVNALKGLLSKYVKKIDFTALLSFDVINEDFDKIYDAIVLARNHAANVRSMRLKLIGVEDFEIDDEDMEVILSQELRPLVQLVKLEAKFISLSLDQVLLFCRDVLPQLQYLHIGVLTYDCSELEDLQALKKSLNNLRVFLYKERDAILPSELTRFCLRHLPKLKIVRHFANRPNYDGPLDITVNEIPLETSALQHLRINPENRAFHLAYPEVTDLMVDWSGGPDGDHGEPEIKAMLQFAKVESLYLNRVESVEILHRFLDTYGMRLHTLICTDTRSDSASLVEVRLSTIFNCCPNLEVLILGDMISACDETEPLTNFSKLRRFERREGHYMFPLLNILAAPDLREFRFEGDNYYIEELLLISEKIIKGEILGKLEMIRFDLGYEVTVPPRDDDRPSFQQFVTVFYALNRFFKVAATYLPNLTRLKVRYPFERNQEPRHVWKYYFGSHEVNLVDEEHAYCIEYLDEMALVHFLGIFNRRKYLYFPHA